MRSTGGWPRRKVVLRCQRTRIVQGVLHSKYARRRVYISHRNAIRVNLPKAASVQQGRISQGGEIHRIAEEVAVLVSVSLIENEQGECPPVEFDLIVDLPVLDTDVNV